MEEEESVGGGSGIAQGWCKGGQRMVQEGEERKQKREEVEEEEDWMEYKEGMLARCIWILFINRWLDLFDLILFSSVIIFYSGRQKFRN
jgi:hypothetical protein